MRTLTTFDLLDSRNTHVVNQWSDANGVKTMLVEWRRRRFKVTVDDEGTSIDEVIA